MFAVCLQEKFLGNKIRQSDEIARYFSITFTHSIEADEGSLMSKRFTRKSRKDRIFPSSDTEDNWVVGQSLEIRSEMVRVDAP